MLTKALAHDWIAANVTSRFVWLGKAVFALTDQAMVSGASFIVSVLLARYLSPGEYGAFVLASSVFLFFSTFDNALVLEPMGVFGPAIYKDRLSAYLGMLLWLHFGLTILLSALVAMGVLVFGRWIHPPELHSALLGMAIAAPWILFFWYWRRSAYLELKPRVAMVGAAGQLVSIFALVVVFARKDWLTPFSVFLLQAVAAAIAGALLMSAMRPTMFGASRQIEVKQVVYNHWSYGRWVAVTALVNWISSGAYYFIVGGLLGVADVAALRALQNFVVPITQFTTAISLLLLPWASRKFAEQDRDSFRQTIVYVEQLFIGMASLYVIALVLAGRPVMNFVYRGKYDQFAYLLPLIVIPTFLTAASQGIAIAVRAMRAPSDLLIAYGVGAGATVVGGILLTRMFGLVGAAIGASISSLGFLVVIAIRYRIRLRAADRTTAISQLNMEL